MALVDPNALLILAIVLVAGVSFGALARLVRLPAVTGQILVGVLMGQTLFRGVPVEGMEPVTHFALGLIAVAVGDHLNIRRLRNAAKRLAWLLLLEATVTPLLVFFSVYFLPDSDWTFAILLAGMAIATAPATVVAIVKETRSKGVFVKTLVAAVALNNIACIAMFEMAHTVARVSLGAGDHSLWEVALAPFRQIFFSAVMGAGAGAILVALTWRVVRPDRLATASIIAILFTAGLANHLGVSSLLSCMFLGVTLANIAPAKEKLGHGVFADFETAILAAFFTLAGMELNFDYAIPGGLLALAMVAARIAGKMCAANLAMRLAGATEKVRRYLGMALVPQAGVAIGLVLLVHETGDFSQEYRDLFLAVGITVVTISEIIGPILTRIALVRSGDFSKDRARLIDFLHEENIVTNFRAGTKEEAVTKLTDLLIASNHLKVDREKLLRSVLDREKEMSTCIGGGLAIPHGELEEGDAIVGAMGISPEGLPFETPDGIPVHCMVVLATPPEKRDHHLEVLAALTRAIGWDLNVQRQLFSAGSSAHAYDILHAEEAEDFNYFLED